MPWWTWPWIAAIAYIFVGGAVQDRDEGVATWRIALDIVEMVATVGFIFTFFLPRFADMAGRAILPCVLVTAMWAVYRGWDDLRGVNEDPELSPREHRSVKIFAVGAVAVLVVPALVLGSIAGAARW